MQIGEHEIILIEDGRFVLPVELCPRTLLGVVWASSALLGGKSMKCSGFIPGATLWIKTELPPENDWQQQASLHWPEVERLLKYWMGDSISGVQRLPLPDTEAYLCDERIGELMPACSEFVHYWPVHNSIEVH